MRGSTKLAVLIAAMLFMGAGCPIFRDRQAADTSREGVILTQGPPPADCGGRRANRLLPYFTIENPEIVLGETIRLDASCSVGEIVSIQWDFDFEAWPQDTPGAERFESAISINGADSDMNNTGPFYQVYTPLSAGTHTARLLANDARGATHLVIHTYVVRSDETRAAAETELAPRFYLWSDRGALPAPAGESVVYVPYFGFFTPLYYAIADGTTGPVLRYNWELTALESGGGLVSSTPLFSYDRKIEKFGIHTDLVLPRGASPNFGELGQSGEESSADEQTADFTVSLTVEGGGGERRSNTQRYRLVDPTTVRRPIAQLTIEPETTLPPGYPMRINNASLFSVAEIDRDCSPRFGCSIWMRIPETIVEIDPGNGQYQEVGRLQKIERLSGNFLLTDSPSVWRVYDLFHAFGLDTKAPEAAGVYTARLRLTQPAVNGGAALQVETTQTYRVLGGAVAYTVAAQPAAARVGDTVTFTARPTVSLPPLPPGYGRAYRWQLMKDGQTRPVNEEWKLDSAPHIYRRRFTEAGAYNVRVDVREGPLDESAVRMVSNDRNRVSEGRTQITVTDPLSKSAPGLIPMIDVVPVGVAIVPGLQNPIYENDEVLYRVRDLSRDASLVQWDYTNDGSLDTYCQVQVFEGFATCTDEKRPPLPAGNYTARVRVTFRDSHAEERTVNYSVTVGERWRPAQSASSAQTAPAQPEYIQIFVGGRSSPLSQIAFPAATPLGFYAVVNAGDSAITSVRWDFDGDGRWDNECQTPTPDGRRLICNSQQAILDLVPGSHRATVFIERNDGPDISLQRVFDIEAE